MANTTGKKFGGRERGTPNKLTKELRHAINDFLNNNIEEIQKNFDLLEPKDKLYFYEKILSYTLPKMQSISTPDIKQVPKIEFVNVSKQFPDEI